MHLFILQIVSELLLGPWVLVGPRNVRVSHIVFTTTPNRERASNLSCPTTHCKSGMTDSASAKEDRHMAL